MSTPSTVKAENTRALAAEKALGDRIAAIPATPDLTPILTRLDKLEAKAWPIITPGPVVPTPITVPTGYPGVTITHDGQIVEDLDISGSGGAYDGATRGIFGAGPFRDVIIRRVRIRSIADTAVWLEGLINLTIEDLIIEDAAYAGVMLLGVLGGRVSRNRVSRIGMPGSRVIATSSIGNNAYGIECSGHLSGVSCSEILVDANVVTDVPLWHGLGTHGGKRITFRGNTVRRVPRAIFLTSDPGQATGCVVTGNLFTEPVNNVATGGTDPVAMSTYATIGAAFIGNAIGAAYGAPKVYDIAGLSTGLTESGNFTGEVAA